MDDDDGLFDFACQDKWTLLSFEEISAADPNIDPWFREQHLEHEHDHPHPHVRSSATINSTSRHSTDDPRQREAESRRSMDLHLSSEHRMPPAMKKSESQGSVSASSAQIKENRSSNSRPSASSSIRDPKKMMIKRVIGLPKELEANQPVKKVKQSVVASTMHVKQSSSKKTVIAGKAGPGGMLKEVDSEMVEALRQHNIKFAPPAVYEPALHSLKDVRRWEKSTGKIWSQLSIEEKEKANKEISILIRKTNR
jgi:hypothetical protein